MAKLLYADSQFQLTLDKRQEQLANDRPLSWDCSVRHHNGNRHWLRIRARAGARVSNGQVREIIDSAEGVTNHHNAVEELYQNRQLLRQSLDLVPNLVYVYNLRLQRNTCMNLRIEQLLGYTSREVLAFPNGAVLAHLMPFDTFPTSIHAAHQVAQMRITTKRVTADLRRKFPEQQK